MTSTTQQRPVLQTITNATPLLDSHGDDLSNKAVVAGKKVQPLPAPTRGGPSPTNKTEAPVFDGDGESKDTEIAFKKVCLTHTSGSFFDDDYDDDDDDDDDQVWSVHDFDFLHMLGQGGAATVYAAREKQSGHLVALKVQDISDDDDDYEDAMYEVKIHDSVKDHACIVHMHAYFFSDDPFGPPESQLDNKHETSSEEDEDSDGDPKKYLIMILELCTGGSLFDVVRDSPNGHLSEQQAAAFFWDAIDALDYIHSEDIIHCDIKPLNFLVHNGSCMLTDFGMGVHTDSKVMVGGSPIYMAPEHLKSWRYMTCDFDHRSDIYSLGVILFEMLVGYLPYEVIRDNNDSQDGEDGDVDSEYASLCAAVDNLALDNTNTAGEDAFRPPILDLRKLNDDSTDEPIYIPPPIFPEFVSSEAQDLISRLMDPDQERRVPLGAAKVHAWFEKVL